MSEDAEKKEEIVLETEVIEEKTKEPEVGVETEPISEEVEPSQQTDPPIEISVSEKQTEQTEDQAGNAKEDSIFITEDDVFNCNIKYYKENRKFIVEGADDNFESIKADKDLNLTFKYPSQGDMELIDATAGINSSAVSNDFRIKEVMRLELARVLVLIRGWSSKKKISNDAVLSLNPKIIKGITSKLREIIEMDGII